MKQDSGGRLDYQPQAGAAKCWLRWDAVQPTLFISIIISNHRHHSSSPYHVASTELYLPSSKKPFGEVGINVLIWQIITSWVINIQGHTKAESQGQTLYSGLEPGSVHHEATVWQLPSGSWCPHLSNLHSTKRGCRDPTCDSVKSMTGERYPSAVYQIPGVSDHVVGVTGQNPMFSSEATPCWRTFWAPKQQST